MKKSLYEMALDTCYHSRAVASGEDIGRPLTDEEMVDEISYWWDTYPYCGDEPEYIKERKRALQKLRAVARRRGLM